jgi:Transglutaminase-like superfamily
VNRLRMFLLLSAVERRLLLEAAFLLGGTKVGLVLLPFKTLRRFLDRFARVSIWPHKANKVTVERIMWAVKTAGWYMPRARTCLTQALTARVLLVRRGYPAVIHIGVVSEDGKGFQAHAWVESGGEVVIGGYELERYTSLIAL